MTIALALLLELVQLSLSGPRLTIDWQALAMLPYRERPVMAPAVHAYVARETAMRKCPVLRSGDGKVTVQADVAVLIGEDGAVRATIPRAINCPTVEQFAAGYVESSARNNLRRRTPGNEGGWYRATLMFAWDE